MDNNETRENKKVHNFKKGMFKKTEILCINPKLKDETSYNWKIYNSNGEFGSKTMVRRKDLNGLEKNENFWLDMENLKKEICEKYAKF